MVTVYLLSQVYEMKTNCRQEIWNNIMNDSRLQSICVQSTGVLCEVHIRVWANKFKSAYHA